jgi:type I restriction enzyme M protein
MVLYKRKLLNFNFPVKPLKQFLKAKPQYGSNQAGIDRTSIEQARYIRITDIDEYGLLKNELGVTAEFVEEKYLLNNNDILFARSGTVGKSYLHKSNFVDCECFYAGYMIRFLVNENLLSPEFLFYYTQIEVYKKWTKAIQRTAVQPNINAEEYKSLQIPVPPISIQAEIVALFEEAYAQKRTKEAQAKELLAGIDGYLLEALGIQLPEPTERKKFFYTRLSKVSGGRFDANTYNIDRLSAIKAIKGCTFAVKKLKTIANFSKTIVSVASNLTYVGLENIESNTGNFIKTIEKQSFGSAIVFKKNQILFPKLRPYLNKVYLAEFDGICSTEFHVLDSKFEDLINEFLSNFLRCQIIVSQTKCLMSGNTLPRLQTEDIENLLIPLPPLSVQTKIAEHITKIRNQAKQLEKEAKEIAEQAKQKVEKMILGE